MFYAKNVHCNIVGCLLKCGLKSPNGGMVWEVMAHSQDGALDLQKKKNLQLIRAKSLVNVCDYIF